MTSKIEIHPLDRSNGQMISQIADWYQAEWDTPIPKTIQQLSTYPNDDVIVQMVLTREGHLVATGGIRNEVNITRYHPHLEKYNYWLGLLYTEESQRGKGLGQLLLEELEQQAKEIPVSTIYLYTSTAQTLYERCGWQSIESVHYKGEVNVVMAKNI